MFSGIQPTGIPHLGNYIGAFRRWVDLQDEFDAFYCVVDLHAMSMPWDPKEVHGSSLSVGATLLACGIDPDRSVLFRQSQVAAHAELAWYLSCQARMGELRRMIQFKEKSKGETESVGVGLFTYPVLQAADILLYQTHGVPVGEDQRQHIEITRDLAARFNTVFGRTFVLPEAWVPSEGGRIMALDDPLQKMSKSAGRPGSVIEVTDPPEAITKKIRSAVTDSGRDVVSGPDKPALTNLLTVYAALEGSSVAALEERFSESGYADFKKSMAEAVVGHLAPIRERYLELMADPGELDRLLIGGAKKAEAIAEQTMADVRARTGMGQRV
ncbi:MAG: tryptophan--tRNA ligase [Actinomycetota bacterium]